MTRYIIALWLAVHFAIAIMAWLKALHDVYIGGDSTGVRKRYPGFTGFLRVALNSALICSLWPLALLIGKRR